MQTRASIPLCAGLRPIISALQAPLIAILGAMLIGAVIMVMTGHNPLQAYWAMLEGAVGGQNLAATLSRAAPIVGMGLTAAVAFRAGFFNLGGEGQLVLGGLTAALVAIYLPLPGLLLLPVAFLAGAVVAGLYAWLAAFFQFRFNVPLLISTLLMNYPARFFASYLVTHPFRDVPSGMPQTYLVPSTIKLPPLSQDGRLHAGIFITLGLVLLAAFVVNRTVIGYEIRMAGLNANFVRYGGVNLRRLGYRVMFASGAIAGIVGAIEVLGVHQRFIDDALTSPLYAWVGLMTALLSGSNPLGVLVAGLFFSAVQTGGFALERATEVPRELSRVLQALIILLVAARQRFHFGDGGQEETKE